MAGKKIRIGWLIGLMLLLTVIGTGWSADQSFNALDKNKDGRLDMKELDEAARAIVKTYDRNGDGRLDPSEFKMIKGAKSSFHDLDVTKDGVIDADELKKDAEKRFKVCDKNGDGALDAEELEACMARPAREGSPAAEAQREERVRLFDRSQRWSTPDEKLKTGDDSLLPSNPTYKQTVSPIFSIYF